MGGLFSLNASSKNQTVDLIKNVVTNTSSVNASSCSTYSNSDQQIILTKLKFHNCQVNFGGIEQKIDVGQWLDCYNSNTNDVDIRNELKKVLDQESAKQGGGALVDFDFSKDDKYINARDNVVNNTNSLNIANCAATLMKSQKVIIENADFYCDNGEVINFKDISQVILGDQIAKCINVNSSLMKAINDFDDTVKQLTPKSTGMSTQDIIILCSVLGALILIFILWKAYWRRKK